MEGVMKVMLIAAALAVSMAVAPIFHGTMSPASTIQSAPAHANPAEPGNTSARFAGSEGRDDQAVEAQSGSPQLTTARVFMAPVAKGEGWM
jgi:hypothetical protein